MKNKWLGKSCNRKQLRNLLREEISRADKLEVEVLITEKLAAGYKARHEIANKLLHTTKEQLITKSKELSEAVDKNIELAKEIAESNKTIVRLEDKLKLSEMNVSELEHEIENVNMRNGNLRQALKEVDQELALAKRPFYKKVFGIK